MTENRFRLPESMEGSCVRPGHWIIEGYDVRRRTGRRATIKDPGSGRRRAAWEISFSGTYCYTALSLSDACAFIYEATS